MTMSLEGNISVEMHYEEGVHHVIACDRSGNGLKELYHQYYDSAAAAMKSYQDAVVLRDYSLGDYLKKKRDTT